MCCKNKEQYRLSSYILFLSLYNYISYVKTNIGQGQEFNSIFLIIIHIIIKNQTYIKVNISIIVNFYICYHLYKIIICIKIIKDTENKQSSDFINNSITKSISFQSKNLISL